jgi:hypothetical protein
VLVVTVGQGGFRRSAAALVWKTVFHETVTGQGPGIGNIGCVGGEPAVQRWSDVGYL